MNETKNGVRNLAQNLDVKQFDGKNYSIFTGAFTVVQQKLKANVKQKYPIHLFNCYLKKFWRSQNLAHSFSLNDDQILFNDIQFVIVY